jgi:hypothetical protein
MENLSQLNEGLDDVSKIPEFYDLYFRYSGRPNNTEVPTIYDRWCGIGLVAALLSRQCWLEHGHWIVYPNMYIMLIGEPAARKTTAITIAEKILRKVGFKRFSADKTSKERFLMDLRAGNEDDTTEIDDDILDLKIDEPSERFVVADEFTDFTGKQNQEFLTMLSRLWDCKDSYEHPKITGKSIVVDKPTVNILSGSQPDMLYAAFPPEAIGQGIMSRFIMVFSQPTGVKVTFPKPPKQEYINAMLNRLHEIKRTVTGQVTLTNAASLLLEEMYHNAVGVDDFRFKHYNNRRFTHLIKLSMIMAAMDCRNVIEVDDALRANTLLHVTETRMPRALGEFGKSRNAEVSNKILGILQHHGQPCSVNLLLKELANDVESKSHLTDVLHHMSQAEKIKSIHIGNKQGWVPNYGVQKEWKVELLDKAFLTPEEFL